MHWRSKLIHPEGKAPEGFRSLATPTYRGSTVVFASQGEIKEGWRQTERGYTYGLYGTPTALELGARIAELEEARHTFLVPSGQAAIALIWLSFCGAGSHALLPWNAYGPNKEIAEGLLRRCNIDVELYDPMIGGEIASLLRPNTALVWCESPGSVSMEVQDVPAIVAAAHAKGIPVALDNTYAAGVLFDAFAHGVDVSMQALTKYVGGHSDLLLGSVSAGTEDAYERLGPTWRALGMAASPDDCSLALRGLQTLAVRLDAMEESTVEIASWLADRPEIETVLHPAFPDCPGHENWKRDFLGSASLFSIVFDSRFTPEQVNGFVDALKLFKIGWSWGGVTSLATAYPTLHRPGKNYGGRIVRLNIGLEQPADLIADLAAALATLS
ncbi:MAG TPA: cystathionine beta-lyase [Acidobacteriaceae bacterium]|jgi:cystathionine beta-lyase